MSRINVAPIVEGHGEQKSAIRTLITRVWSELLGGEYANVLRPIRVPRSKLVRPKKLLNAIDLAALNLGELVSGDRSLILVLFDADEDAPCVLAPILAEVVRANRAHLDVAISSPTRSTRRGSRPPPNRSPRSSISVLPHFHPTPKDRGSERERCGGGCAGSIRKRWIRCDSPRQWTSGSVAHGLPRSTSSAENWRSGGSGLLSVFGFPPPAHPLLHARRRKAGRAEAHRVKGELQSHFFTTSVAERVSRSAAGRAAVQSGGRYG